ncbi:MAG: tetratricopeptide repeat protein [Anaerolineales bacterium]
MLRFLLKRAWIGILFGLVLILLPNAWLRSLAPVAGDLPTPLPQPTPDPRDQAYQQGLTLASTDPLTAVSFLDQVAFSDHPMAEEARTLASAIQAARLADDEAYLFTAAGQALAAIGEWQRSREALVKAVQLDPEYAEAWAYLGEAQYQNGEDSFPALQRALELNPDSVAAQLFNALYWQRQGDFLEANLHFYIASQLDPQSPSIYIQWGQNAMLAGEPVEARQYFEKAAELSPDDPAVWRALARYSIESELYVQELGVPAAGRVLIDDPEDVAALVLLGRAHILLGDGQAGQDFLERALGIDANDPLPHYYLGLYFLAQDNIAAALPHLNQVIALAPDTEEAELAAELIVQYSQ